MSCFFCLFVSALKKKNLSSSAFCKGCANLKHGNKINTFMVAKPETVGFGWKGTETAILS